MATFPRSLVEADSGEIRHKNGSEEAPSKPTSSLLTDRKNVRFISDRCTHWLLLQSRRLPKILEVDAATAY